MLPGLWTVTIGGRWLLLLLLLQDGLDQGIQRGHALNGGGNSNIPQTQIIRSVVVIVTGGDG